MTRPVRWLLAYLVLLVAVLAARWETADLAWFIHPPREVQAHPKSYEGPDIEQDIW